VKRRGPPARGTPPHLEVLFRTPRRRPMARRMETAHRPKVLIVDDAEDVRRLLGFMLSGEGIDVVAEGADGAEGVALAMQWDVDVVVMDLRMPVMDGIEATRLIKEKKPNVQIFVFTAVDTPDEQCMAMEAGADLYLIKGTDALTLPERILATQRGAA
jgi:CheY-like chemotaxis protein